MSVAVQVTNVVPGTKVAGALLVMVTFPQLSVAVAVPRTTCSVEQISMSDGHAITGASLSVTVTVIEQVEVFPQASEAVQLTVVVPTGYNPEAFAVPFILLVNVTELQVSIADGCGTVTIAPQIPGSLFTVMFAAQVNTGAVIS
jgi:hypothetical protein